MGWVRLVRPSVVRQQQDSSERGRKQQQRVSMLRLLGKAMGGVVRACRCNTQHNLGPRMSYLWHNAMCCTTNLVMCTIKSIQQQHHKPQCRAMTAWIAQKGLLVRHCCRLHPCCCRLR